MQKLSIIFVALFFISCATKVHVVKDIPPFTHLAFEISKDEDKSILLVSKDGEMYHFVYLNSLGVPITKKSLKGGVFSTEGFFPPNKKSEILFVKVLDFIKSQRKKDKISFENGDKYEIREIDVSK